MPRSRKSTPAPEASPGGPEPAESVESAAPQEPPGPVPWDFRQTTRFSVETLRGIRRLFDHWGPLIETTLPPVTRLSVAAADVRLDTLSFEEYARGAIDNGVTVVVQESSRFQGPVLLRLEDSLALVLLDRELGGPGVVIPRTRSFSALELSVMRHPVESLLRLLEELVRLQLPTAAFEAVRVEGTDQFQSGIPATEPVLWIRQAVTFNGFSGLVHLVLPFTSIEPVLAGLAGDRRQDRPPEEGAAAVLRPFVGLRHVSAEARLGPASLTAEQLAALRPGDVVALNVRVGQGFWMTVEGRPAFLVHDIGRVGIRTAVRVAQQLPSSFLRQLAGEGEVVSR